MLKEFRTIYDTGVEEIIIEKSKFIGYAKPVYSEAEAIQFVEEIKSKHKDATHNVPAYVIGDHNEVQRYSDDGEPSGTAGIPVLEVIKKEDLRNVAVVVTRYFGGIKLGAGGLVRAYTKGAKIALEAAGIIVRRAYKMIHVKIDYTLLGKIQNEILQNKYLLKDTQYDDAVHFYVYVKIDEAEQFFKQLTDWTNAKYEANEIKQDYLIEMNGKIIYP